VSDRAKPPPDDLYLEQRVTVLEHRADAIDAQLLAHEQAISELHARVTALENHTDAHEDAITALDVRVTALEDAATIPTPEPPDGTWGGVAPPVIDNTLPTPEPPEPAPTDGMAVVIITSLGETAYVQSDAEDMGDYDDPAGAFLQHCWRAPRQDDVLPGLTVWFRTDADGGHGEVIVELGVPLVDTLVPANMGAYTAEIWDTNELLATIEVPSHPWYARWRWQSAPRPVRVTPAELIASGLVPHYDGDPLADYLTDLAPQEYTVMGFAGLVDQMGWTGDRPDIGPMTGWQAQWLIKGNNASTVIAQGEASGTMSMHLRDPVTGSPLDLVAYDKLSNYPGGGDPIVPLVPGIVSYDSGHSPSLSYLPWLMTGDPYYLEALQFQANLEIMGEPSAYRYTKAGRYGAWALRNKLYAASASPVEPPQWILPRGVFHDHMEAVRQSMLEDMANEDDPILSVFRCRSFGGSQGNACHPAGTYASLWQCAMESLIYGLCVQFGFDEWREPTRWKVHSEVKRIEGVEWPRATPVPYQCGLVYTCSLIAPMSATDTTIMVDSYGGGPWPVAPFSARIDNETFTVVDNSDVEVWHVERTAGVEHPAGRVLTGPTYLSWTECAMRMTAMHPDEIPFEADDPTGMNELYNSSTGSVGYAQYARAALAVAVRNGVTEAVPAFSWIDDQFRQHNRSSWHPAWGWLIT
jgi:hypothetical protein